MGKLTLEERIYQDKSYVSVDPECGIVFGKYYYAQRRKEYHQEGVQLIDDLDVVDENAPIDPKFFENLEKSRQTAPNREPLTKMLDKRYLPKNQSELVGILRHGYEVCPCTVGPSQDLLIAIAKWIVALEIKENYEKEFCAYLPHLDRTLAEVFSSMKSDGLDVRDFIDTYRSHP